MVACARDDAADEDTVSPSPESVRAAKVRAGRVGDMFVRSWGSKMVATPCSGLASAYRPGADGTSGGITMRSRAGCMGSTGAKESS